MAVELNPQQAQDKMEKQQRQVDILSQRIQMLESENGKLIDLLERHDIDAGIPQHKHIELPPPVTEAIDDTSEAFALLAGPELRMLEELFKEDIFVLERSETQVDVGHWLNKGTLWIAATDTEMSVFAAGGLRSARSRDSNILDGWSR